MQADPRDHLFQQHAAELTGYLNRRLQSPELAAELCQEVYLRLRRVPRHQALDNPRAFLFRIARNLLIDHLRQQNGQPTAITLQEAAEDLESPAPDPETAASDAQVLDSLREALGELPHHVRQALLWNRLEGLTQKEIAGRLGVSERMVGKYILRALNHCQARLVWEAQG